MDDHHHDSLFLRHDRHQANKKGEYGLVQMTPLNSDAACVAASDDNHDLASAATSKDLEHDDEDDDPYDDGYNGHDEPGHAITRPQSSSTTALSGWQRTFFTPLFPDDRFVVLGSPLLDGVRAVRCFKFFVVTWLGLLVMFYFVRWMVRFRRVSQYSTVRG